jgi:hypothetical protein
LPACARKCRRPEPASPSARRAIDRPSTTARVSGPHPAIPGTPGRAVP